MSSTDLKLNDLNLKRYIGEKIKQRWKTLNLSQTELAKRVGIKPQQLFKYEKGIDKISVGQLLDVSKELSVPINFFYERLVGSFNEFIVMLTNNEGKRLTLKLLDEGLNFSEIKIIEKPYQSNLRECKEK